jgi:ribosomal protein S18 acetylase RimI-like enzyme
MSLSALSVKKLLSYDNDRVEDAVSVFVQDWTVESEAVSEGLVRRADVAAAFPRLTAFVPAQQPPSNASVSNNKADLPGPTLIVETAPEGENSWDGRTDLHYMLVMSGLSQESKGNYGVGSQRLVAANDPQEFINDWRELARSEEEVPVALLTAVAERADQRLLTVTEDQGVVATIRITRDEQLAGLSMLAVDVNRRGQGLGTSVVKEAMVFAQSQGARQFHLQVDGTNHKALGLYRRLGAVVLARYRYLES